jgi:hypothetical protein
MVTVFTDAAAVRGAPPTSAALAISATAPAIPILLT